MRSITSRALLLSVWLTCMATMFATAQEVPSKISGGTEAAVDSNAEGSGELEKATEDKPEPKVELTLEQKLINISDSIESSESGRVELQRKLKQEIDEEEKTRLRQELAETNDIILGMRDEYVDLATNGTNLYSKQRNRENVYDWRSDLELIVRPLLDQLKELTERPRKIEQIESDIKYWKKRESNLKKSVVALRENIKKLQNKRQIKKLTMLLESAESRYKKTERKLRLLEGDLKQLMDSETSLWSTIVDGVKSLFVNMGLNFTMALLSALVVYYSIGMLGRIPVLLLDKRRKQYIFVERSVKLIKHLLGALLASLVYVTILYIQAEWVILLLSIAILIACLLGMKGVLPRYLVEIRTLLNLGSIRQGERLMYQGLPWKISMLDVYTYLHNPLLDGHLRVPLTELSRLSSRPYHKDEPWFASKVGDYVKLNDGTYGCVIRQTPEQVQLQFGGIIFNYSCAKFVDQCPKNFSADGFTITQIFGFDYELQPIITTSLSSIYADQMERSLRASRFSHYIRSVSVEFHRAGSSSLDFRVIVGLDGAVAAEYYVIKRMIQSVSVDIATKNGWAIPFQQVTVHYAENS